MNMFESIESFFISTIKIKVGRFSCFTKQTGTHDLEECLKVLCNKFSNPCFCSVTY